MVIISGKEPPKRKRKQMPIEPAIAIETPKRTKVQAQRKFAQGQGNPSTSSYNGSSTVNSSAAVPGSSSNSSSKDVIVTEPIMATPPPAKDFLTYVCFQRNPVFQSLNYLGKATTAAAVPGGSSAAAATTLVTSPAKSPIKRLSRGEDSGDDDNKPRSGRKTKHVEPKPFVSPVTPLGAAAVMQQSPISAQVEKPTPPVKRKPGRPPKVDPLANPLPPPLVAVSAPAAPPLKSESEYETASEHDSEDRKQGKNTTSNKSKSAEGSAKKDRKVSREAAPTPLSKAVSPLREEVSSPVAEQKEERITRHMAWRHSYNNTPIEPTIKRIKKTPAVVAPTTSAHPLSVTPTPPVPPLALVITPTQEVNNKKGKREVSKKKEAEDEDEEDSEFSSDDDKPLVAKSTGKNTPQPAKKKAKTNVSDKKKSVNIREGRDTEGSAKKLGKPQKANAAALSKRKSSPVPSNSSVPSTPPKKISKAVHADKKAKETPEPKQSAIGKKKDKRSRVEKESDEEEVEDSPKRPDSTVKRKYLSKELEKLTADISQTPTDFSENDTKTTARPSRKTKEAATIYMELIGHKLNLHDTDEEGAESMDSYPELPNVKKTQQLEEECRQNVTVKVERRGRKKKPVVETEEKEPNKELNKSFSDSDEEPLATKLSKKPKKGTAASPGKVVAPTKEKAHEVKTPPAVISTHGPGTTSTPTAKKVEPPKRSPVKLADAEDILNFSMNSFKSPVSNYDHYSMAISTPDNSKSALNRTPISNSAAQVQHPPLNLSNSRSPGWPTHANEARLASPSPDGEFLRPPNKSKPRISDAPISPIVDDTSPQNIASLMMMNPLPSKEESGKIFGIASVTLAQSSGPQGTKCTLGKCGSIHNPSLGPAVPTEALLGEAASSKDRRKSKVNMSQEQIQKWLIECAAIGEKEILPDDLADIDYTVTPKPSQTIVDSPMDEGSPSLLMRKREAPRPMPLTTMITQPATIQQPPQAPHQPITKARNLIEKFEEDRDAVSNEVEQSVKQIIQKLNFDEDLPAQVESPVEGARAEKGTPSGSSAKKKTQEKTEDSLATSADPTTPTSADRKPIYNRRTPVYNKAAVDTSPQPPKVLVKQNSFTAFSPENEHSVYDFDREGDDAMAPMKPPFRRQGKGESPRTARGRRPASLSPQKPVTSDSSPQVSVALNPTSSSASVALQMSLPADSATAAGSPSGKRGKQKGSQKAQNISPTADGNDSDSEGQTIYIPLQNASVGKSGKNDQLIQGVSVKLGTEGPDGCVIMKAKLVTKSAAAVGSTSSITDAKTQELMKSIINSGKEASTAATSGKAVPVGTVQPRFKSNETSSAAGGSKSGQLIRCGSNSSLASQKSTANRKTFDTSPIQPSNNTAFPRLDDPAQMVEAPVFRPTEKEFQDPIEFIERIMPIAARFGLCRIIPPSSFKPECRVSDEMRFMAYNQYVHKMLHRWGPSAKELWAIRKYLATQSIKLSQPPLIGGMEVDLPRLYHTVQEVGGLKEVIEKKKWARVAEEMCIPKTAQDRVSKLDDIYCKYLLPYDTLSSAERQKLFEEVEADWAKREAKARRNAMRKIEPSEDGDEEQAEEENSDEESSEDEENDEDEDNLMECIVKGRSMALSAFFRVARNTMTLWFKNTEPPPTEVESEFWRHVAVRDSHVCVHSGSIDSSGWGYGFPAPGGNKSKGSSPCAKHPWNLKVLTNNSGSVLRSLGPVMGVTVPTLHVGMLFSACCWYRDPHGLPWIEYLHTGGSKIWYGVPDEQSTNFRNALTELVPTHCQNKTIWLPCDTAMVPPHILTEKGVSLCRTEQQPGQFVIIFPRAYTSSLATGYVVSESVYFATNSWLDAAHEDFKDIQESREPTMFSLDQLIFAMAADQRCSIETLAQVEPMIKAMLDKEKMLRSSIKDFGVVIEHRKKAAGKQQGSGSTSTASGSKKAAGPSVALPEEDIECDLCRTNLFVSMVRTETEDEVAYYCLQHGLMYLKKGELQAKESQLIYNLELTEIDTLTRKLKDRIRMLQQQQKKGK